MKKLFSMLIIAVIACFAFAVLTACIDDDGEVEFMENNKIVFSIGETELTATLVDNTATQALVEKLKASPLTIDMSDYGGWEKVGGFGFDLPTSNEQITAQPCEFVLYQGNQLVIFYGSNSWSYTRLGKFDNVTQSELKEILGSGNVTVTLTLENKETP